MRCVILAAGIATRLRPITTNLPKCLLPVGGLTILQRTIENVVRAGIAQIAIVVGFEAEKIRAHVNLHFPAKKIRFILNPNYRSTNNAYSLLLAREFCLASKPQANRDDDFFVVDSDIVFHPGLMQLFMSAGGGDKIAARVKGEHDEEEVHIIVNSDKELLRIGKDVELARAYGESVGISSFSQDSGKKLFEALERRVRRGHGRTEYYESAFQEIIDVGARIRAIDVSEFPVIEIDSQIDLEFARNIIVPLIDSGSDVRL